MRVAEPVLAALSAATLHGRTLVLAGQLDRKMYQAVAKVIEAAGGKWNRQGGCHMFAGDAAEAIEPVLLTGEVVSAKQEFGFFETPRDVVVRLLELADIKSNHFVLEPSAGNGAIAARLADRVRELHCIEIRPEGVAVLQEKFSRRASVVIRQNDFLGIEPFSPFDRVVMNPPFAKQADIDHVLHAMKFLTPGGRLVSVMSAGAMFREDKKAKGFRDYLYEHGGTMEPLPDDSFKPSGTSVRTCVVTHTRAP